MAPEKHSEENNVCQKSHIAFNQGNIKNRRFIAYLARIYLGLLLSTHLYLIFKYIRAVHLEIICTIQKFCECAYKQKYTLQLACSHNAKQKR